MSGASAQPVKRCTRVVSTPDGGSAFEDVELALDAQRIAADVPPMLVGNLGASQAVAFVRLTDFNDPHPAGAPQWVVMLRGVIEVEVSDGTRRQFGPGDLVFAADTTGRGHITRTVGEPPFEALGIVTAD